MKTITISLLITIMTNAQSFAQEGQILPYHRIPDPPAEYTAGAVAARMVDGLGFRYYWATEGLRQQDMSYRPAPDVRSIRETVEHIYGLSRFLLGWLQGDTGQQPGDDAVFEILRAQTLRNFALASRILKHANDEKLMTFMSKRGDNELTFWYVLNGPLADAIYHTGQVVAFRRAAGNPIPKGVSVLMGVKK